MKKYLNETKLLDFRHPEIEKLVNSWHWNDLAEYEKIGCTYHI